MQSHTDCSLCFHANYRLYGDGTKITHTPKIKRSIYGSREIILLGGGMTATNSMFFYRDNCLNTKERPAFWANSPVGDIPLELYMSTVGHIGYIDEYMSTYRIEAKGSWTNNTGLSLRALDLGRSLSRMLSIIKKNLQEPFRSF